MNTTRNRRMGNDCSGRGSDSNSWRLLPLFLALSFKNIYIYCWLCPVHTMRHSLLPVKKCVKMQDGVAILDDNVKTCWSGTPKVQNVRDHQHDSLFQRNSSSKNHKDSRTLWEQQEDLFHSKISPEKNYNNRHSTAFTGQKVWNLQYKLT